MATLILVHGAFHGRWCWERLVPLLETKGHQVLAPDLPGMGEDDTPHTQINLGVWGHFVADLARKQAQPAILLGHSRGGIVISQAAEYAPDAVAGLIYLTAMLVPNGATMMGHSEALQSGPLSNLKMLPSADGISVSADPASVGVALYNTTPHDLVERALKLLGPEPLAGFTGMLKLSDEHFGSVPRGYIECAEDQTLPLSLQQAMQRVLSCEVVSRLNTDHSPFYSAPERLAEAVDAMVSQLGRGPLA